MTASLTCRIRRLFVLMAAASTLAAASEMVEVEYFGVDFGHFETYSWKPGVPAPNFQVERAIRQGVEKQLAAKGLLEVDGEPDCYVITRTAKDRLFPVGVLRVEIFEAGSERLVWRGVATGVVGPEKIQKRQKIAAKAVKKMFKQSPELGD